MVHLTWPYSQGYGFSCGHVWMWELDNKKAEHWRIDAFELWCWRRLLRVPWTARRSNQSILKEISPGISLGGMMLKLKLQYFGHLTWRADSLKKTLMLGKIEGRRRRGWQRMRWHHQLDGHEFEQALVVGDGPGMLQSMGLQRKRHDWVTELNLCLLSIFKLHILINTLQSCSEDKIKWKMDLQ